MEYSRLLIGLLLPWLGGYYWLTVADKCFNKNRPHILRQAGFGFFIGYAGLQALILLQSSLTGSVTFWPVMLAVTALVISGAALSLKMGRRKAYDLPLPRPDRGAALSGGPLLWILLGVCGLHLLFSLIEVLNRPVYPWDAWLAWIYRAKAWYYSGNTCELANPVDWLREASNSRYTIAAAGYPTFASIVPFWAALSLGQWSETLVNLPVLCCGVALALGIYGQSREYGLERLPAMASAYALLSIPLVGTHLSLAGYADIWVMGFTGLGFVALTHGLLRRRKFQTILGMGLIALGVGVKNEGIVWLYMAFAMWFFATARLSTSLILLAVLLLCSTLAWYTGYSYLDIPVLGGLGVRGDQLHIPLAGHHTLQTQALASVYLDNLFILGNWNILWFLVVLCAASLFFLKGVRARKVLASFLLLLVASQLFIFGLTEQGRWATSYTAVNRLILHFTPAIVFILVATWHGHYISRLPHNKTTGISTRGIGAAATAATALILVGVFSYLALYYPPSQATTREFRADELNPIRGGGTVSANRLMIDTFDQGVALAASGPISIDADSLQVLEYHIAGETVKPPTFFWRPANDPETIHTMDIEAQGASSRLMADHPGWQGQVIEFGFVIYAVTGSVIEVGNISLHPGSLSYSSRVLWQDVTGFERWSQVSINWLAGGRKNPLLSAPVLAGSWLFAALAFSLYTVRKKHTGAGLLLAIAVLSATAWGVLDMRWLHNRLLASNVTLTESSMSFDRSCLDIGDDCQLAALAARLNERLEPGERILIATEIDGDEFRALRFKYHLLPLAARTHARGIRRIPREGFSYIAVLKARSPGMSGLPDKLIRRLSRRTRKPLTILEETPEVLLLAINK